MKHSSRKRRSIIQKITVGLILLFCAGVILENTGVINIINREEPVGNEAKTTSTIPSAQADYTDDAVEENKVPATGGDGRGSAEIKDNGGAPSSDTSSSIISTTGEITLYMPKANSKIASGQEISGKSTLSKVHYRVIDSVSGVIATGLLNVVNGNFSGSINFSTAATEGRLDIFATKSDGAEYSNIEVPIRFK